MRRKSFQGAWLLVAWVAFAPAVAWGQAQEAPAYAPSSWTSPLPIGSTRPEDGGFFAFAQATYFTATVPLKSQTVGVRGFRDRDGSITGVVDQFVGSGAQALNVAQLTGKDSYVVGTEMGVGWKFRDGGSLALNWMFFSQAHYSAAATLSPRAGVLDPSLANSFLYADVYNIPPEYSGPDFKIRLPVLQAGLGGQPSAQAAFGIWNGANIMTIDFMQRFQQWELVYREPIFETEDYRLSGIVGPRFTWIWERFRWRTTAANGVDLATGSILSQVGPQNVALYSNVVSNRMYGAVGGCEQEYYLGHGIVLQWKLEGALFVDTVKARARYELEDKYAGLPQNKNAKRLWSIVPEVDTTVGIMWYPQEFIQVYAGYQLMGFLNTVASRRPIDFDYSNLDPHWSSTSRLYQGLKFGLALTF